MNEKQTKMEAKAREEKRSRSEQLLLELLQVCLAKDKYREAR